MLLGDGNGPTFPKFGKTSKNFPKTSKTEQKHENTRKTGKTYRKPKRNRLETDWKPSETEKKPKRNRSETYWKPIGNLSKNGKNWKNPKTKQKRFAMAKRVAKPILPRSQWQTPKESTISLAVMQFCYQNTSKIDPCMQKHRASLRISAYCRNGR